MKNFVVALCISAYTPILFAQDDFKADPVTGKLEAFISLWEVKHAGLQVSVGIARRENSPRVGGAVGTCGVGWDLQPAGTIYRTLRALPDDYEGAAGDSRRGWLSNSNAQLINTFIPSSDDDLSGCSDEAADWNFINGLGYTMDSEPDVFQLQAPGLSAQFVFGTDGIPKFTSYQDLKIDVVKDAAHQIIRFIVINNQGVIYTFDQPDDVTRQASLYRTASEVPCFQSDYNYYKTALTYKNSWHLTSMKSPGGGSITFTYTAGRTYSGSEYIATITEANVGDTLYTLQDKFTNKMVSNIFAGIQTVEFRWANDVLDRIICKESAFNDERRFSFSYTLRYNNSQRKYASIVFLDEIKQEDDCIPFPSYQFKYQGIGSQEEVDFPIEKPIKRDFWGYYNAQATGNIPAVYFYANASGSERFRLEPINGSTPTTTLPGDSRQPNGNSGFGAVTQIIYPTGGHTNIAYEAHSYYDALANAAYLGGGVRVRSIATFGGELPYGKGPGVVHDAHSINKTYEYQQPDGRSSGKLVYHPVLAFATGTTILRTTENLAEDEATVLYERVIEKYAGKGKTLYEFSIHGTYPETSYNDWTATPSKIARKPGTGCIPAGNIKNGAYTFPFSPNTNFAFERVVPVRVSEYSESNVLVRRHAYTYARLPVSGGVVKGLKFERVGDVFHFGLYKIMTNLGAAVVADTLKTVDDLNPANFLTQVTTSAYNSGHNLLESVTTRNSDGTEIRQRMKYVRDFNTITSPSGNAAIALQKLNAAGAGGLMIETTETQSPAGGTAYISNASLTVYNDFGNGQVLPYQQYAFPQNTSFTAASLTTVGSSQKFDFDPDYLLQTTIDQYDDQGNVLTLHNNKKQISTTHYGFGKSLPIATITQASVGQTVYEGFETISGYGLVASIANPTRGPGRTGERALQLTSSFQLQRAGIEKGAATYRASVWVLAGSAATLSFQIYNGATLVTTVNLSYPASSANTWKYQEAPVAVSAAPALFTLKVSSNATAFVDDIVFIPLPSTIALQTHLPLVGITSTTDDRGFSNKYEYDATGRLVRTYDRNRNVVEVKEYHYQKEPAPTLNSNFSYTPNADDIVAGTTVSFTAPENCVAQLSYLWKVNGIAVSTAATFSYTFESVGNQDVELTVSNPVYGDRKTNRGLCIVREHIPITLNAVGGTTINKCDASYAKTFGALATISCSEGAREVFYAWYYNVDGEWMNIPRDLNLPNRSVTFDLSTIRPMATYAVKCVVTARCGSEEGSWLCNGSVELIGEQNLTVIYNNTPGVCP